MRFALWIMVTVGVSIGCGAGASGGATEPDQGRGWWCPPNASGRCFRAHEYCAAEANGMFCERSEQAYCFWYEQPIADATGRYCWRTADRCRKNQAGGIASDHIVTKTCAELR